MAHRIAEFGCCALQYGIVQRVPSENGGVAVRSTGLEEVQLQLMPDHFHPG